MEKKEETNTTTTSNQHIPSILKRPKNLKTERFITSNKTKPLGIPNYEKMSAEEQQHYREYFQKQFNILHEKKSMQKIDIPDNMPLSIVHRLYNDNIRELKIAKQVDRYKLWFIGGLAAIQLTGKFTGKFNIDGLVDLQYNSLPNYEPMLYSFAETQISMGGEPSPLYDFATAAGISVLFFLVKQIANKLVPGSSGVLDIMQNTFSNLTPPRHPQPDNYNNNDDKEEIIITPIPTGGLPSGLNKLINSSINGLNMFIK